MSEAQNHRSGKGHHDENFPVASHLIHPRHRPAILAFYNFVRTADDIADHATLSADEKLALLDHLEDNLIGDNSSEAAGVALRLALAERGLDTLHAQDLLTAFRMDITKPRYADWDELIHYCRYSAMPVGRFVLDVHGESQDTWPANDALCAALQIINHLQDCGKDFRDLDRVYIPLDALAAAGATVEDLGLPQASPALRACLTDLSARTLELLRQSAVFSSQIKDLRLCLEVSVIQRVAERLTAMLARRDPLSERVHLGKPAFLGYGLLGVMRGFAGRLGGRPSAP